MHDILKGISNQIFNKADHKEVLCLVKEALNCLEEKEQIKGNWHPLGFIHIPLGIINDQSIRLHIWPQSERRRQQPFYPIHTHIFELKSHILSGTLKNTIYKVSNLNFRLESAIYEVNYNNTSESILKRTDRKINIMEVTEETLKKGDYYSVKRGEFHTSEVKEGEFAATIALTYEVQKNNTPLVIRHMNGKKEYTYYRNICPEEEVMSVISHLKKCL